MVRSTLTNDSETEPQPKLFLSINSQTDLSFHFRANLKLDFRMLVTKFVSNDINRCNISFVFKTECLKNQSKYRITEDSLSYDIHTSMLKNAKLSNLKKHMNCLTSESLIQKTMRDVSYYRFSDVPDSFERDEQSTLRGHLKYASEAAPSV